MLENRNYVQIKSKSLCFLRSSYMCCDISKLLETLLSRTFLNVAV